MGYRVAKPCVIVTCEDEKRVHLYEGAPVPSNVKGDELKRLKDGGFISGDDDAESKPASSRASK